MLPFDLHVLSMPPAFNLSQDQTLQFNSRASLKPASYFFIYFLSTQRSLKCPHSLSSLFLMNPPRRRAAYSTDFPPSVKHFFHFFNCFLLLIDCSPYRSLHAHVGHFLHLIVAENIERFINHSLEVFHADSIMLKS